mmetsp:Transcript_11042/g.18030  ORF Transcript_11042/g.18030 Transcript_11042/m.18030 type:complete len:1013 (+) Transcript_11042:92-3130(+)
MPSYQKNQRVEGYYDDDYYPAIIFNINPDGSYVVHFDDGDILEDMVESELRLPQAPETTGTQDTNDFTASPVVQSPSRKPSSDIAEIPAFKPKPKNTVDVQVMLSKVEAFLLPKSPNTRTDMAEDGIDIGTPPSTRLAHLLHEMSKGEHIRALQFLYRDSEDDLKLAMNVRTSGRGAAPDDTIDDSSASGRITSKKLLESITEGRCRAIALTRICHGSDSIESLKALVDLSSVYAVQGLWDQVSKHMGVASQKLLSVMKAQHARLQQDGPSGSKIALAFEAASYVVTVFKVLREHTISHKGYVTKEFIEVVTNALENVVEQSSASAAASSSARRQKSKENVQSSKARKQANGLDAQNGVMLGEDDMLLTDDALYDHFPDNDDEDGLNDGLGIANSVYGEAKKSAAHALSDELHDFFNPKVDNNEATSNNKNNANKNPNKSGNEPLTWGQVVYFLRHESTMMKSWYTTMDEYFLSQNKVTLKIVFQMGDKQNKGICHPLELSQNLMTVPSAMKILAGTQVHHDLGKMHIELPISINTETGDVVTLRQAEIESMFNQNKNKVQNVKYELPIVWEEFLAQVVQQNCIDGANPLDMLRIQIWNLLGLCNVFSDHLHLAEENMRNALGKLESLGLEMEVIAVDLYNAISQLMVVKHRKWHEDKKERCRIDAEKWLHSVEGKHVLRMEVRAIKMHYASTKGVHLSNKSAEDKAASVVFKLRTKHLIREEADPTKKDLEAAYRYLIRAYEILEKTHGMHHASVASASLAVASVLNLICNFEESKEWLVRSVRIMEKMSPLPVRAIAFTQAQLSNVLIKLKHPKSAEKVLSAAVEFYVDSVNQRLSRHSRLRGHTGNNVTMGSAMLKDATNQSKEDVETAIHLSKRLMTLHTNVGATWQAAECAEKMADMADAAYGWDSLEAAVLHKLAGEKQSKVRDWGRACGNFKKCLDTYQVLYGEKDKRCAAVAAQMQKAQQRRDADLHNDPKYDDAEDDEVDDDGEGDGGRSDDDDYHGFAGADC